MSDKKQEQAKAEAGIASEQQNAKLEHSRGGVTTRDDVTDLGVPMLPGDPNEPQGPEDAAGGPTRGDYSGRIGNANYRPHSIVPVENPEPNEPRVKVVAQRPIFSEQADVPGKKGGVEAVSEAYTEHDRR